MALIATIEVRNQETGALVATGRSGDGGEFRIAVSPGDYSLRAIPHHEVGASERALRLSYSCEETRIRVETDRYNQHRFTASAEAGIGTETFPPVLGFR